MIPLCYTSPVWLIYLLTALHVVVCLFLIIVVLLQSGKAADLAGAFGGMGSQTAFGPRGSATLLSKATTISSRSSSTMPSPKLNASAPRKWMCASPGRQCSEYLKW